MIGVVEKLEIGEGDLRGHAKRCDQWKWYKNQEKEGEGSEGGTEKGPRGKDCT